MQLVGRLLLLTILVVLCTWRLSFWRTKLHREKAVEVDHDTLSIEDTCNEDSMGDIADMLDAFIERIEEPSCHRKRRSATQTLARVSKRAQT